MANQRAKSSLNLCHWFTSTLAGGPCTRFVVGASERKATNSRESARIASRGKMETRLADYRGRGPLSSRGCPLLFYKKYFKDVSREFDEFQVNTHHLCKLRCYLFYKKYFKDVSREFDEFRVNTHLCKLRYYLFYKNISRTSAMSSTNFGSILIFASCVITYFIKIFQGRQP